MPLKSSYFPPHDEEWAKLTPEERIFVGNCVIAVWKIQDALDKHNAKREQSASTA